MTQGKLCIHAVILQMCLRAPVPQAIGTIAATSRPRGTCILNTEKVRKARPPRCEEDVSRELGVLGDVDGSDAVRAGLCEGETWGLALSCEEGTSVRRATRKLEPGQG